MKNLYLKTNNSGYGKRLAVLLTVVASFALSTSAWAGTCSGGFDNKDGKGVYAEIQYRATSSGDYSYYTVKKHEKTDEGNNHDFGVITNTFKIQKATVFQFNTRDGWYDNQDFDEYSLCNQNISYKVVNSLNQEKKSPSSYNLTYEYIDDYSGGYRHRHMYQDKDMNLDALIKEPGEYRVYFWFEMNGGCGNCNTHEVYQHGDNEDFVARYTYPGFDLYNGNFSLTEKQINGTESEYVYDFRSFGWQTATVTLESEAEDAFYFKNGASRVQSKTETINTNNGSITVYFDPKNHNAKLGENTAKLKFSGSVHGVTYRAEVTAKINILPTTPTVTIGEPPVVGVGPSATLSGYLKYAGCDKSLREYGFYVYSGSGCTSEMSKITAKGTALSIGDTWKNTVSAGLQPNTTYSYKPYVKSDNANKETKSSACYTFTTGSDVCKFAPADTIYYTIDSSIEHDDPCALVFQSIENALVNLKSHSTNGAVDYWWDSNSSMLRNNVVFQIVPNKAGYGVVNERVSLTNINKYDDKAATPAYELVLRSSDDSKMPRIYGLDLENSRKVTLKNLNIYRDSPSTEDGKGHACILAGFNSAENALTVGKMKDAQLRFINCQIEGNNFCCLHLNGIDGLYMENCNLIAKCSDVSWDTYNWGGSIKMMNCKNVTLLRNNFKGQHSNNIFAQNVQNMLIMNNVFWNDNMYVNKGSWTKTSNSLAVIRLINFGASDDGHKIKNVGMYYNTLYLADNGVTTETDKQANFLTLGGVANGEQTKTASMYGFSTIDFMYNNCYSYDTSLTGKTSNAFCSQDISTSTHITKNNFWDAKAPSASSSNFAFGNVKYHVNMARDGGIVCWNAPFTPEGLVIKGAGLNEGSKVSSDVSGLGADKITSDRLYQNVRPDGAGWTLGAYQQASAGAPIETIVWEGSENNVWDNRNNWRKLDGSLITCVDVLSTDLKVIIPEIDSVVTKKPENIRYYPVIHPWGETGIDNLPDNERVRAGVGVGSETTPTKFASNIDLQYGASLLGVENLYPNKSGDKRYDNATSHITIAKDEWVLVGSVIAGTVSGNYYKNFEPHVYMQQFEETTDGSVVKWGIPFTQLDEQVGIDQSFAIMARNQYGQKEMMSASLYYKVIKPDSEKVNNGTKPETFDLGGSFAYENALPTINLKKGINILNNAYPAVLKPDAVKGKGDVYVYDYDDGDWRSISLASDDYKYIKPQSGFIIDANSATTLNLTQESFDLTKDARYRLRSAVDNSMLVLKAYNTATGKGSPIGVGSEMSDAAKIFNGSVTDNAELYIMNNGGPLSTQLLSEEYTVIPLGIRNKGSKSMDVKFELTKVEGLDNVILEDRSVSPAVKYNLLEGAQPCFLSLPSGDIENRFFLVIGEEEDLPTEIGGDDEVKATDTEFIDIYSDGDIIVITSSDDVVLQYAEIVDMSGRTTVVKLKNAHYNIIKGNAAQGAYAVNVIGDTMTKSAKVIVK